MGLALGWLASLPILSWVRIPIFTDERALWQDAVNGSPLKPRPRVNLGIQAHRVGDVVAAEANYRLALELSANPARSPNEQHTGFAVATTNLALLALERGDIDAADVLMQPIRERYRTFQQAEPILEAIRFARSH